MKSKKWLPGLVSLGFWLVVWQLLALRLDLSFAVPTPVAAAKALFSLVCQGSFWLTVFASLGRIFSGLLGGVILGTALAALSVQSRWIDAIISPAQRVIRCTPVASFIMVLWILAGRDRVPGAISLLMVMPVIWQSLTNGYRNLDPSLGEVLQVFRGSLWQRLILYILPSLKTCFLTGLVNATGLAWKAGIAAEIIAFTGHSIGREISNARNLFDGPQMFAWTICVVILSLLLEKAISLLAARKEGTDA